MLLALAAPFSHQLHLKLRLDCVTCHTTAPSSQAVRDNNLPAEATCKPCHPEGRQIKTPRSTIVTRFSHQRHLKMGNPAQVILAAIRSKTYFGPVTPQLEQRLMAAGNACMACHRGLDEEAGALPHMADCLVCHTRIDAPFSCEQCHAPGGHLKPASHTPMFHDTHSTRKVEKTGCAICHGRRFTCQGCH